jgi:hypothetical protein
MVLEKVAADAQAQHGIAEKLQAFVAFEARGGHAGVSEGVYEQVRVVEVIVDEFFTLRDDLTFHNRLRCKADDERRHADPASATFLVMGPARGQ